MKEIKLNGYTQREIDVFEEMGESHFATSLDTPMLPNAFDLSDAEKIEKIAQHFGEIMDILGLDRSDDSLKGTPYRVAKMYVQEIFSGLNPANKPKIALFDNKYKYQEMLIEKNILVQSTCEHHFLPIYGHAHVAYISSGKVIGLSKINRLVQHFAKRPQVQERLTMQILEDLKQALETEDLAVYLDAKHLCVSSRGVKDIGSSTITMAFSGKFEQESYKQAFLQAIH